MNNYFFIIFLLLGTLSCHATIVEHFELESVFQYIDTPNTLVVFDIDNTLATSDCHIGNDQWFSHLVAQKQKDGIDLEDAIHRALSTYYHVAFTVPLIPVEPTTPEVIKKLHEKNIPTLGLTARSVYLADRTLEQLEAIDIRLSMPLVQENEFYIPMPTLIPSMYKQGILFCSNNNKGEILLEFFKKTGYYPAKVIFIDDKEKYLFHAKAALEKKSIPSVCIRYGACDERVKNFDPAQADREFADFKAGRFAPKKTQSWFSYFYDVLKTCLEYLLPA